MKRITHSSIVLLAIVTLLSGVTASCYKDVTLPKEVVVTKTVSFADDLVPIFNKSCNSSGCHNSGGTAPNLTAGAAYNALINGGYINITDPEDSELYLWMTGNRSTPMPISGPDPNYNGLVLAWIKQGALNN